MWQRCALVVSISDLIAGEDGHVAFTKDQAFWDSVKVEIGQPPKKNVYCEGTVTWDQQGTGVIDFGNRFIGNI